MNELDRALDQISEIHDQLLRNQESREIRALPVAGTGLLALAAAALEPRIGAMESRGAFLSYWMAVAVLGLLIGGSGMAYAYFWGRRSEMERRQTRVMVGRFAPCLVAGALLSILACERPGFPAAFLPGLWAVLFSLGIFAVRPNLPRATGWVALFYLVAGIVVLAVTAGEEIPSPWSLGLLFGPGQLAGGAVLYWNLERSR